MTVCFSILSITINYAKLDANNNYNNEAIISSELDSFTDPINLSIGNYVDKPA